MLSFGEDSVVPSTSAGDQQDTSMEIEVETVAVQGRATNQPNKKAQVTEPGTISYDQPQVEIGHSIARDRPRRDIRRPARYNDDERLITYALSVAEEVPKGVESSTYTEAISCPSSPNWILTIQKEMESLQKNRT